MNLVHDRFRFHAYVDGELTPDEAAEFEREIAEHPDAMAEVAAVRAQKQALHARYDGLLSTTSIDRFADFGRHGRSSFGAPSSIARNLAWAATVVVAVGVGIAAGWIVRGQADERTLLARAEAAPSRRDVEGRLQSFVQTASLSHAIFVPEVRHPVEVAAADEAHLVTWLSKRLAAPLVVPHLGDVGWDLLGGRLLPDDNGPVAQFMYQDRSGQRMTLAVSTGVAGRSAAMPAAAGKDPRPAAAAFRIATENGNTVFYWLDADYAYALTGKLSKDEMTSIASRVYRQLERDGTPATTAR